MVPVAATPGWGPEGPRGGPLMCDIAVGWPGNRYPCGHVGYRKFIGFMFCTQHRKMLQRQFDSEAECPEVSWMREGYP